MVGCYFAHESRNSADISPQCNRLASKIADNTERAFLVVVSLRARAFRAVSSVSVCLRGCLACVLVPHVIGCS